MGALVIVLIFVVLSVCHFYLKCTLMTAITTFFSTVLAMIIAFGYYETVAGFAVSKGWSSGFVFSSILLLLFWGTFAILFAASSTIIRKDIDLGEMTKRIVEAVVRQMEVTHPTTGKKLDWSRDVTLEIGAIEFIKAKLEKILSQKGSQ